MDGKNNVALIILISFVWLTKANTAVNGSTNSPQKQGKFEFCADNTFCQLNGKCYQSVTDNKLKFCSCNGKHYGVTCENNVDTLMETIVYALAAVSGLFLLLLIVVVLKCIRYKGELKDCQQQESWSIGKVMTKPASPMYTQHTFVEIEKKASITSNGNLANGGGTIANGNAKFDMADHGLNDANTFQPISEDDKQSEKSGDDKKEENESVIGIKPSNSDNDDVDKNRKSSIDVELSDDFLNQQEHMSTYSESESINHLIPRHPRGEHSQDGSDIEQNMDQIYRDYYAARAAFDYEFVNSQASRPISPSHGRVMAPYPGRSGAVSPRYGAAGPRSPYDRRGDISPNPYMLPSGYDRPMSPSSQTSSRPGSRPGSRPISPAGSDFRLHPNRGLPAGYGTNYRNLKKPKSPKQPGQYVKRSDYTDSRGRPRSMGDLQMISGDYRRNRARSVDNLDTISFASSVENIHTGKVTRVVPRKNGVTQPRGKGIWARTAGEY